MRPIVLVAAILATSIVSNPDTCFADKHSGARKILTKLGRFVFNKRVGYNKGTIKTFNHATGVSKKQLIDTDRTQVITGPSKDIPDAIFRTEIKRSGVTHFSFGLPGKNLPEQPMTAERRTNYKRMYFPLEVVKAVATSRFGYAVGAAAGTGAAITIRDMVLSAF